jgi:hypothetical protein
MGIGRVLGDRHVGGVTEDLVQHVTVGGQHRGGDGYRDRGRQLAPQTEEQLV